VRADAADAARRHAEDYARGCDQRVASAADARHEAECERAEALACVARLRAIVGSVEGGLSAAMAAGDRLYYDGTAERCGVVLTRDARGAWRARTLLTSRSVGDDGDMIDGYSGAGDAPVEALADLARVLGTMCRSCAGSGEDERAVEPTPCPACRGGGTR